MLERAHSAIVEVRAICDDIWSIRLVRYRSVLVHQTHSYFLCCRKHVLADPTSFEEPLLDATLTVVLDEGSENVISIVQYGPSLTSPSTGGNVSLTCIRLAKERVKTVAAQMKDAFA